MFWLDKDASKVIKELDSLALTSELIRAARALLRWSQGDLAEASGVSIPTIKRLENVPGLLAAHRSTVTALRRALESAGIEFINGIAPGVRLKTGAKKEDPGADRGR
jgi:transcriptional regulator with XRE-family HTH domain